MRTKASTLHGYIQALLVAVAIVIAGVAVSKAAGNGQPRSIVYEGYLEENGEPAVGEVAMQFKLTDAAGDVLWTSALKQVTPVDGHFSAVLGDANDTESLANVWDNAPDRLFLKLSVGGEELSQSQEIFPAAMAIRGVPSTVFQATLPDGSIQSRHLAANSVLSSAIAQNAVKTEHISPGAVGNLDLASGAVTSRNLDLTLSSYTCGQGCTTQQMGSNHLFCALTSVWSPASGYRVACSVSQFGANWRLTKEADNGLGNCNAVCF